MSSRNGPPRNHRLLEWGKRPPPGDDERLLRGYPIGELRRGIRIFRECMRGFRCMKGAANCVTVFGSARFGEDHRYYALAREIGRLAAETGLPVMTGGGPGIMEAANRGAKEHGGVSLGCNIQLPMEQVPNAYLDRWVEFRYFFIRETAVLIQTRKIERFPLVLMGVDFWSPLMDYLRDVMVPMGTIDPADPEYITLTDDPAEAMAIIAASGVKRAAGV